MRVAALALATALLLPVGASAQVLDISRTYDPSYLWFDAPNTTDAGDARIRIVFAGREGAAAMTPNQYWHYAQAYRLHLGRLVQRRSVAASEGAARHFAFRDVLARYPNLRVDGIDLKRTYAETVLTPG